MSNQQQIEAEIEKIQTELKSEPDNAELIHDLGVGYLLLGKLSNAIIQLKKAVRLDRTKPSYHFNLGNAYSENGQYKLAISSYLEAVEINPEHIPSLNNLADSYELMGEGEKSLELFQYLVKIAPDDAVSHFNLGNFYLRQNRHIEAVKCYEQALERDWKFTDAYYNIAWVLQQAGALEESVEYTNRGLSIDPSHEELLKLKAELNP